MQRQKYEAISAYADFELPREDGCPLKSVRDFDAYLAIRRISIATQQLETPDPVTSEVIIDRVLTAIDNHPFWKIF